MNHVETDDGDEFIRVLAIPSPEFKAFGAEPMTLEEERKLTRIRESWSASREKLRSVRSLAPRIDTRLTVKRGFPKTDIYLVWNRGERSSTTLKLDDCFEVNGRWYITEPIRVTATLDGRLLE